MRIEKRAVLAAAARLLAVNRRASTQEIAAAAGISRASLHRLFPTRHALIEELGVLALERYRDAIAAARLDDGPALDAIARLVEQLIPIVHEFLFLIGETQLEESERLIDGDRELDARIERLLRRGQEEGALRADLPARWLLFAFGGLLLAAAVAEGKGEIAPRETARLVLTSFLAGAANLQSPAPGSDLGPINREYRASPPMEAGMDPGKVPGGATQRADRQRRPTGTATAASRTKSQEATMAHHDQTTTEPIRLDLRDPHVRATAYATYDELRAREPVAPAIITMGEEADATDFSGTFGRESFLVTGYEDATALLLDDRFSVDPRVVMTPEQVAELPPIPAELLPLTRNLLSLDPPDHTRLRKLVQPSFTARAIAARRPRIQAIADELLDAAEQAAAARGESEPDRRLELINAYAYPLPMTVISELLGVPAADRAAARAWSETLIQSQVLAAEETITGLRDFSAYLRGLFEEKRRRPTDDLTTELVRAEEDGDRLDEDELLSMVFILIVAGHVTTVNLIGNGVLALLSHPDQLARLRANPALAEQAVEEILRYSGPVEMASPRFPQEDVEVGGRLIPRGRAVLPVLAAADRDPARFPDPDEFVIERPEAHRNIAFGKGIHACLGAPLARVEGEVALSTLFARFPDLRLAEPPSEAPLHPSLFRGPERLDFLF